MNRRMLSTIVAVLAYSLVTNVQAAWVKWNPYEVGDGNGNTESSTATPDIQTVSIDVKPGRDKNQINLAKATAVSVAILTDSGFDALAVDPSSVRFGPAQGSAFVYRSEDSNGDDYSDLRLRFKLDETGIACGDTQATLTGMTFDGQLITAGANSISVICD